LLTATDLCVWIDGLWCIFTSAKTTEERFTRNLDSCRLKQHPEKFLTQQLLTEQKACTKKALGKAGWNIVDPVIDLTRIHAQSLPTLGFIKQVHPDFDYLPHSKLRQ
jgi:hypothetical protein